MNTPKCACDASVNSLFSTGDIIVGNVESKCELTVDLCVAIAARGRNMWQGTLRK